MCGQREHSLSPNQLRVVVALAKGERYRDIAQAMGVRIGTVSSHRRAALERLGICTNQELVLYCYRTGLIR